LSGDAGDESAFALGHGGFPGSLRGVEVNVFNWQSEIGDWQFLIFDS
jgi:hypothetical protein